MSGSFSNTDTGNKQADPYTAKNLEEPSLQEKVEDLLAFIDKCKFCMMTAQTAKSDLLASRCMALAGKVCAQRVQSCNLGPHPSVSHVEERRIAESRVLMYDEHRRQTVSTSSSTPTRRAAKQTISLRITASTLASSLPRENGPRSLATLPSKPIARRSANTILPA